MNITDIGTGSSALRCTTTFKPCCFSGPSPGTHWYFPNGSRVGNTNTLPYYRSRTDSGYPRGTVGTVLLHRNPEGATTGIFRCEIRDASGAFRSIYVGIYTAITGESCRFTQHIFISVRALILKLSPSAFAAIMNRLLTLPCHSVMNQYFRSANACSEPKSPSLLEMKK